MLVASLIISFAFALMLSVVLTPVLRSVAVRMGMLDLPSQRKAHSAPTPRAGGIVLFVATLSSGIPVLLLFEHFGLAADVTWRQLFILGGASVAFIIGLWDDIKGLPARHKLSSQVVAACLAIYGGVIISKVTIPINPYVIDLGYFGVPITIIWYLLVINGVNLIDGLDGLAAGVTLLVCVVLLFSIYDLGYILVCIFLASIAGATLGFLRYNFYPATIFMGDCGSYFLGFMLATLSIMGSVKGKTTVTILAPIVALGLPLFDSIFSALRRFVMGHSIFAADKDHLHHKLLSMGLNHRRVVIIFYGVTVLLGFLAIWLMHYNDSRAALVFLILAIAVFLIVRKLRYFDFLAHKRIIGWFNDLYDDLGLPKDRRSFRGLMMSLAQAQGWQDLWNTLVEASASIGIDYLRLRVRMPDQQLYQREACMIPAALPPMPVDFKDSHSGNLQLSLEINNPDGPSGLLELSINLTGEKIEKHILRRVEQLQRALKLCRLREGGDGLSLNGCSGEETCDGVSAGGISNSAHEPAR